MSEVSKSVESAPPIEAANESRMPLSRVKRIIKQDRDIQSVSSAAVYSVSAATKMFVSYLAEQALMGARSEGKQRISYDDIANAVSRNDYLEFLSPVIPKRCRYAEIAEKRAAGEVEGEGAPYDERFDVLEGEPDTAEVRNSDSSKSS